MVLPIAALMMGMGVVKKVRQDAQDEEDQALERAQKVEDRKYTLGQRDRTLREQADADATKASMKLAGQDVAVNPNMVPDPSTDNRDVGLPGTAPATQDGYRLSQGGQTFTDKAGADAAVASMNSVGGKLRRQSAVQMAAGNPTEGASLAQTADQWEAHDSLKEVGRLLATGGWNAVPEIYARYNDGKSAKVVENGKGGASVITVDDKTGKEVGRRDFEDLPQLFATIAGRFDPKLWAADEVRRKGETESKRHFDEELKVKQKNADSQEMIRAAQAEAAGFKAQAAMTAAAAALERAQRGGQPAGPAPVWDDKADAFLRSKYVVKDEMTGQTSVDGAGMRFAKTIALAKAKENGGDTTIALGDAFDVDGRLRAAAMGKDGKVDAKKLNDLRAEYMTKIATTAQPSAQNDPPPRTTMPGGPAATARPAAPVAAAPAAPAAPVAKMASTAGADKALAAIEAESLQALGGLVQQRDTARQQLAAAAKSGDPKALATYAQAVTRADTALKTEAAKRLGNRADQFLQANP